MLDGFFGTGRSNMSELLATVVAWDWSKIAGAVASIASLVTLIIGLIPLGTRVVQRCETCL
jgi:hypothetical protein